MKKTKGFSVIGAIIGVAIVAILAIASFIIIDGNNKSTNFNSYDFESYIEASKDNGNIADHVKGDASAPVLIFEYADYQCPGCASINPYVNKAVEELDGKLAVIYRSFLLSYHKNATAAASAAEAAGLQGYWKAYADKLFEEQSEWVFWKDGTDRVGEHNAQVLLAIMNKFDALDQALLFAKVASCLLKLENAIGIYKAPTCYEKQFYINFANSIKDDALPMPILIHAGMYLAKSGLCAYTSGLRVLGYEEMEVINSQLQPDQVIGMLYAISEYVVSEEVTLKDGETIGFTDEQKIPIAVSKGVSVEGETIKIGL